MNWFAMKLSAQEAKICLSNEDDVEIDKMINTNKFEIINCRVP